MMMEISYAPHNDNNNRVPLPKSKSNEEICVHSPEMPRPNKNGQNIISPRRSPQSTSSSSGTSGTLTLTPPAKVSKKLTSTSAHNTPTGGGRQQQQQQKPRHNSKEGEHYKSPKTLAGGEYQSPTTLHHSLHDKNDVVVVNVSSWHNNNNNNKALPTPPKLNLLNSGKGATPDRRLRRSCCPRRSSSPSNNDILAFPFMEDALARRIQSSVRVFLAKCRLRKLQDEQRVRQEKQKQNSIPGQKIHPNPQQLQLYSQPLQPPSKHYGPMAAGGGGGVTAVPLKSSSSASAEQQYKEILLLDGRSAKMFVNVRASDLTMSDFGSIVSMQSFATSNSDGDVVSLGSFVANAAESLKEQKQQSKNLVNDILGKGNKYHYSTSNIPRWDANEVGGGDGVTPLRTTVDKVDGMMERNCKSHSNLRHNNTNTEAAAAAAIDPNISTAAINGKSSSGNGLKIPRRKPSLQSQLEQQRQKLSMNGSNHKDNGSSNFANGVVGRRRNLLPPRTAVSQVTTTSAMSGGDDSGGKLMSPRRRSIAINVDDEDEDVDDDDEIEEETLKGEDASLEGGAEVPLSSMLGGHGDDDDDDLSDTEQDGEDQLQPLRPATMSGMPGRDGPVRRPVRTLTPDASICSAEPEKWRDQHDKYGNRNGDYEFADDIDDDDEDETEEDDKYDDYCYGDNHCAKYPSRKLSLNSWSGSTITSVPFLPTAKTTIVQQSSRTMATSPVVLNNGELSIESGEEIILVVQEEDPNYDSGVCDHNAAAVEENLNDSPVKRPERKLSPF